MQTDTGTLELTAENAVAGGRCLAGTRGRSCSWRERCPASACASGSPATRSDSLRARSSRCWKRTPARREAPCPHAAECGGCDFQHAERDLQLSMKRAIVADAFRRIAKIDVEERGLLEGPEAVGPEFGWRNRIRLSFDSAGRPGLLARGSHDVVPIDTCLLPRDAFGETFLPWMRMLPPWRKGDAAVRHRRELRAPAGDRRRPEREGPEATGRAHEGHGAAARTDRSDRGRDSAGRPPRPALPGPRHRAARRRHELLPGEPGRDRAAGWTWWSVHWARNAGRCWIFTPGWGCSRHAWGAASSRSRPRRPIRGRRGI